MNNFVLVLFNMVLVGFGLMLIISGQTYSNYLEVISELHEEVYIGSWSIATGSFLLLTVWVAALVPLTGTKWALISYGVILIITLVIQFVMGVFCFLERIRINAYVHEDLTANFELYYNGNTENKTVVNKVDEIQLQWKCCGMHNVTNLEERLPASCCQKESLKQNCTKIHASKEDCRSAIIKRVLTPLNVNGVFSVVLSVFQFIVALWSFYNASKAKWQNSN